MRIEWGGRSETLRLGPLVARPCASCQRQQPFSLVLRYRVSYFGDPALCWVSRRNYASVCDACGGAGAADAQGAEARAGKDPIPWKERYGFAVGGAAIALLVLLFFPLIRCLSEMPKH